MSSTSSSSIINSSSLRATSARSSLGAELPGASGAVAMKAPCTLRVGGRVRSRCTNGGQTAWGVWPPSAVDDNRTAEAAAHVSALGTVWTSGTAKATTETARIAMSASAGERGLQSIVAAPAPTRLHERGHHLGPPDPSV